MAVILLPPVHIHDDSVYQGRCTVEELVWTLVCSMIRMSSLPFQYSFDRPTLLRIFDSVRKILNIIIDDNFLKRVVSLAMLVDQVKSHLQP